MTRSLVLLAALSLGGCAALGERVDGARTFDLGDGLAFGRRPESRLLVAATDVMADPARRDRVLLGLRLARRLLCARRPAACDPQAVAEFASLAVARADAIRAAGGAVDAQDAAIAAAVANVSESVLTVIDAADRTTARQ